MSTRKNSVRLTLVSGGMSPQSTTTQTGNALAQATQSILGELEPDLSVEIETIRINELAGLLTQAVQGNGTDTQLTATYARIATCDALIAATPIYFATPSGLFNLFFQLMPADTCRLHDLPVALVANGGTCRHSLVTESHLRPMFTYLRASPVRTALFASPDGEAIDERLREAAAELARAVYTRRVMAGTLSA